MIKLNNLEVAEVLIEMGNKDLLQRAPKALIFKIFEEARDLKVQQEEENFSPDSQQAADAATEYADRLQEAEEMLRDQEITPERLQEIAEAASPIAEKQVVLGFGS